MVDYLFDHKILQGVLEYGFPCGKCRLHPLPDCAMVILVLILILAGSLAGAVAAWLQDASFWGIVLGYVAGGWAGLLGTAVLCALASLCRRPRRKELAQCESIKRQHSQNDHHAVMPPEDAVPLREPA